MRRVINRASHPPSAVPERRGGHFVALPPEIPRVKPAGYVQRKATTMLWRRVGRGRVSGGRGGDGVPPPNNAEERTRTSTGFAH